MITGFVRGQRLTLAQTVIAADAINYLTGQFIYETAEWFEDDLSVWAHFKNGETQIDAELTNGRFGTDAGVNLTVGTWTVWLTGHAYENAVLVLRITTTTAALEVTPSGISGDPLPTGSFGETILGEVRDIYNAVGDMIEDAETNVAAQLDTQNEEVSALMDAAFGGLKNWRDGLWLKLWAGTEAQYAQAVKSADTIYLIDMGLEGGPAPAGGGGT